MSEIGNKAERSWFAIDGRLLDIDFQGQSDFRFPEVVAEHVIVRHSAPGEWVLDPFAGFGTTLQVAARLGRQAIGFEIDADRAAFGRRNLAPPSRLFHAGAETIASHDLPKIDLVFTSPPYLMVRLEDDPWGPTYFEDMKAIFAGIRTVLKPAATVVLEVSNIRTEDGFRPLAWQLADALSTLFKFDSETVRCNTDGTPAGPGVDHSYILVFRHKG